MAGNQAHRAWPMCPAGKPRERGSCSTCSRSLGRLRSIAQRSAVCRGAHCDQLCSVMRSITEHTAINRVAQCGPSWNALRSIAQRSAINQRSAVRSTLPRTAVYGAAGCGLWLGGRSIARRAAVDRSADLQVERVIRVG